MKLFPADRRALGVLAVLLFVSYAYFYQAGGWNQNSRFALVRALLEHHSLRIDDYKDQTGDRAVWRGHYYSDKAPGVSLAALVPAALGRLAAAASGIVPESADGVAWTSYVATVFTCGLLTAAAALIVTWLGLAWGYSRNAALFAGASYGLATPAWCYATLFMGHAVAAGCLMMAFGAAIAIGNATPARARRLAWLLGVSCGWAVLSEFPTAVPVVFVVVLALVEIDRNDRKQRTAVFGRIVAGGAIAAAILFGYNAAAFRSPFHIGYASEEGFEQLRTGLFGITVPAWWRIREILVGTYRGLLPIAPLMGLGAVGLVWLLRQRQSRWPALVAAAIAVYYLLLNASYFYWEGGWAFGPRHVTPALPFVALGLIPLWDRWSTFGRSLLTAGFVWGSAITLVAVATTPQPPGDVERPVQQLLLPAFLDGDLSLNTQRFIDFRADAASLRHHTAPKASWNLGMKLGLTGHASLAPLAAVWLVCGWLLTVPARTRRPSFR